MAENTAANKINVNDVVVLKDEYYTVVSRQHSKMARGAGIVKMKLKNLRDNHTISHTTGSDQQIELADYITKKGQYLYSDDTNHYFMDSVNYEQFSYPIVSNPSLKQYLKEDLVIDLNLASDKLLSVALPIKMKFKVVESPPNEKGDTASGATKQVTLETGLKVNVPLFIAEGDFIILNTTNNRYVERAKG